ncbi:hypothetical protein FA95DRAFT_1575754 [Auriscalpium vulgare]|uniref:Uncharacterized protein n=1 Tax=Auriscalpium vulgare TaxID=40419 RepID=A0ACB8RFF9_9AGAM|nr:hypothetical protein FA95DRAFT_1575754 [Auriscalpium vulgare]
MTVAPPAQTALAPSPASRIGLNTACRQLRMRLCCCAGTGVIQAADVQVACWPGRWDAGVQVARREWRVHPRDASAQPKGARSDTFSKAAQACPDGAPRARSPGWMARVGGVTERHAGGGGVVGLAVGLRVHARPGAGDALRVVLIDVGSRMHVPEEVGMRVGGDGTCDKVAARGASSRKTARVLKQSARREGGWRVAMICGEGGDT